MWRNAFLYILLLLKDNESLGRACLWYDALSWEMDRVKQTEIRISAIANPFRPWERGNEFLYLLCYTCWIDRGPCGRKRFQ